MNNDEYFKDGKFSIRCGTESLLSSKLDVLMRPDAHLLVLYFVFGTSKLRLALKRTGRYSEMGDIMKLK